MRWCTALVVVPFLAGQGQAIASNSKAPGPCLHYQQQPNSMVNGKSRVPEEVRLSGELIERTFWGPPFWGEHPKTDSLESAWIIVLDTPICVLADPSYINNAAEFNVIVVQIIVFTDGPNNEFLRQVSKLIGHHVAMTGVLDHAITGHNRTPVMMEVASIAAT
jgi:hypothetical protein